jgi:light-regulated signal transduction histidine kinase (bacteriophytochrome)
VGESYIADSVAGALQVERMLQALAAYRAVTDQGAIRLTSVDCNEVVGRTLEALQGVIAQSGAKITTDLLPTLMAGEAMLDHVFHTLIDNAIRYRDQAAPRIHISAVNTFDRWLFSVRDNGIGIAQKNAEQVFGMFKRLHGSERPGNGLNLSLSRKLVERQGGRIWVESAAGEGAAFRFTIPRAPEAGLVMPGERE